MTEAGVARSCLIGTVHMDRMAFRARLTETLNRATKILHTSRVPAPTWRAWREFERKVQDQLRAVTENKQLA